MPPLNTIGGYLKVRPAHVLAHGEEKVVPLETHVGAVAPNLCKSRVHVHVGAARNLCERRLREQVPAGIEQQIGAAGQLLEFPPAHPEVVLALVVVHAATGLNAKLARSLRESVQHVLQAVGILQRIDGPQMVYPETLHSHSLQAEHVLQPNPRRPRKFRVTAHFATAKDHLRHPLSPLPAWRCSLVSVTNVRTPKGSSRKAQGASPGFKARLPKALKGRRRYGYLNSINAHWKLPL